jgi:hypothetical protein
MPKAAISISLRDLIRPITSWLFELGAWTSVAKTNEKSGICLACTTSDPRKTSPMIKLHWTAKLRKPFFSLKNCMDYNSSVVLSVDKRATFVALTDIFVHSAHIQNE